MPQTISKYMAFSLAYQTIVNILSILSLFLKFSIEQNEENKFVPSKLNMAFFILTSFLQTAAFMTNYIGRPFRESITENFKLFASLNANIFLLFILLFNINPDLTNLLECVILELHEQVYVLCVCIVSLIVTFYGEKFIFKKFN